MTFTRFRWLREYKINASSCAPCVAVHAMENIEFLYFDLFIDSSVAASYFFATLFPPPDASLLFFSRSQGSSAYGPPILNFHHAGLPFLFVIGYPILINVSICFFVLAFPFYCFLPHLLYSRSVIGPLFIFPPHPPSIALFHFACTEYAGYGTDNEYSNFRRDSWPTGGGASYGTKI